MLNGKNLLDIESELHLPENRRIIVAYTRAEILRLKPMYDHLGKQYPSINKTIKELKNGYDPIEKMKGMKTMIQAGRLQILNEFFDVLGKKEDPRLQEWKRSQEYTFSKFCDVGEQLIQIREPFYVHVAIAVKSISKERGISIDETVENVQYVDAVSRVIHPTREEAEYFLRTYTSLETNILEYTRRLNTEAVMPTRKAVDAVQKATIDYKLKEFDRVYEDRN